MRTWLWLGLTLQLACGSKPATQSEPDEVTKWAPKVDHPDLNHFSGPVSSPHCNFAVISVTHCGDMRCPAVPEGSDFTCPTSCCTADGKCGLTDTNTNVSTGQRSFDDCVENDVPDPRCPDNQPPGLPLRGCCGAGNHCGYLLGNQCQSSMWLRRCDEEAFDRDAGFS